MPVVGALTLRMSCSVQTQSLAAMRSKDDKQLLGYKDNLATKVSLEGYKQHYNYKKYNTKHK